MNKFAPLAAFATLATFALLPIVAHAEAAKVVEGKMIYSAAGQRIAPAYRVNADGSVQIILEGRLITIPAASFSQANGKVVIASSKSDLMHAN